MNVYTTCAAFWLCASYKLIKVVSVTSIIGCAYTKMQVSTIIINYYLHPPAPPNNRAVTAPQDIVRNNGWHMFWKLSLLVAVAAVLVAAFMMLYPPTSPAVVQPLNLPLVVDRYMTSSESYLNRTWGSYR